MHSNDLRFARCALLACGRGLSSYTYTILPRYACGADASHRGGVHPARAYPCARPLRAAASSCRTSCAFCISSRAEMSCVCAVILRLLNGPSESPPSPSGQSGIAASALAAEYAPDPSPTTVGQHCGKIPEHPSYMTGCHIGAAP